MNYLLFIFFMLHLAVTCALCSVAWFVQVIFYPSFKLVSKKRFQEFEVTYLKRSLYTVLPLIVLEGITAILFWYKSYNTFFYYPAFINFLVLIGIWVMHFRRGMKLHRKLAEEGYHTKTVQRLSSMHRYRTLLWSMRTVGLVVLAFYVI